MLSLLSWFIRRTLIAFRHECWLALRLFNETGKDFFKAFLTKQRSHGGYAQHLALVWVVASSRNGCRHKVFGHIP